MIPEKYFDGSVRAQRSGFRVQCDRSCTDNTQADFDNGFLVGMFGQVRFIRRQLPEVIQRTGPCLGSRELEL
jgi:hypothetical protein